MILSDVSVVSNSLLMKRRGELRDVPRIYDGVNSFICLFSAVKE